MDATNNDRELTSCSWKKAKTCDESNCKDFISGLPDDILVHILSFLPIKDAITTSYIRRFGNLWRQIRVLDFGECVYSYFLDGHRCNFRKFIRCLLDSLESDVLDELYFNFDFFFTLLEDRRHYQDNETGAEWEKGIRDHLTLLITYALRKQVKVLEFDLRDGEKIRERDECYILPDVLSSNYLTHLTLSAINMKLCRTTDLKVLKVMLLDQVTLTDEAMEKLLAGCPLLEDMTLENCYGLKILVCKNPNLKRVMLTLTFKESQSLIISCPYVLSLNISGWVERAYLLRASSAIDVSIYFSRFHCTRKQPGVRRLLKDLSKCETFRPCSWTVLVFTIWNLRNVSCPSFEWKNLVLKLGMTKWHHPGLSLLLRNSQSLQTLTLNFYPTSYAAVEVLEEPEAEWMMESYEFDMEEFWEWQEASFPSLETITINGYLNEPYVVDILVFLLRNAPSLQKLFISTQNLAELTLEESDDLHVIPTHSHMYTSQQLLQLSQKFKSLPRVSPEAVIYLSGIKQASHLD